MKHDLRVVKTQESLRHALLELLKQKPLESITVAELCRLAKINRGTFYSHYKDVHEVFRRYLEVIVEDFRKAYEEPYRKTGFKIENIKSGMIQIFHHVKKYQDFYQIVFDKRIPLMYYYLLFDTVRSFMKESLAQSLLDSTYSAQTEYLLSYQTNAILGLLLEWHRQEYNTPATELNEHLITILSLNSPFRG
ncbi:TetR/AcrR family transcriptional regulator [Ornithinibacillus scapharcae]|uniref:TetR/AcrR family transcriptional regulator n=1 Tax=Ornithinibacillus scapharcae TaxID=1147159 RepID=UPI000225B091|nr:TetR/AcrR family transcriptional regulator [Ornithinibacillus scapharcae]